MYTREDICTSSNSDRVYRKCAREDVCALSKFQLVRPVSGFSSGGKILRMRHAHAAECCPVSRRNPFPPYACRVGDAACIESLLLEQRGVTAGHGIEKTKVRPSPSLVRPLQTLHGCTFLLLPRRSKEARQLDDRL